MRNYFHGSNEDLPVGQILTGRDEDYKQELKTLGTAYKLLEERRPKNIPVHHECIFMCSANEDNSNDYGLDDIEICGGSLDYISKVVPEGLVFRFDMNWMSHAQALADEIQKLKIQGGNDELISQKEKEMIDCVDNYWKELPSPFGENLWEYTTSKAKVVETSNAQDYSFDPEQPQIVSNYQIIHYICMDDTFHQRIKYVYPQYADQEYICVFDDNMVDDDTRKIIGVLIMGENDNKNVLYAVSVDPEYRNQGLAKKMIDEYFRYSSEKKINISISSFTEDGEQYLKKYIDGKIIELEEKLNVDTGHSLSL